MGRAGFNLMGCRGTPGSKSGCVTGGGRPLEKNVGRKGNQRKTLRGGPTEVGASKKSLPNTEQER